MSQTRQWAVESDWKVVSQNGAVLSQSEEAFFSQTGAEFDQTKHWAVVSQTGKFLVRAGGCESDLGGF